MCPKLAIALHIRQSSLNFCQIMKLVQYSLHHLARVSQQDIKMLTENLKTFRLIIINLQIPFFLSHILITTTTILSLGEYSGKKFQSNDRSFVKFFFSHQIRERWKVNVFSDIIMMTSNFTLELLKWKTIVCWGFFVFVFLLYSQKLKQKLL